MNIHNKQHKQTMPRKPKKVIKGDGLGDLLKTGRKALANLARAPAQSLATKGIDVLFDKLAGSGLQQRKSITFLSSAEPSVISYTPRPLKPDAIISHSARTTRRMTGGRADISGGKAFIRRS